MNWVLLRNSLLVGGGTTMVCLCLGFISALWLTGLHEKLRTVVLGAAVVALALPPFLVTNCWLHLLGHAGIWHRWLPVDIFSLSGSIWILTLLLWPLSLMLIWGAWQRLEPAQLEADMLVRGWSLIRALLFPLAVDAVLMSGLLTLVLALNNFSVPAILQVKVLPAEMWIRFNTELDTSGALRSCCPLLIGPIALLFLFYKRGFPWPHREPPVQARLFRQQLGPVWYWSSGACAILALGFSVLLPLAQILFAQRTWIEMPGALAAGQNAIWNSFWYAAASATTVSAISLLGIPRRETQEPQSDPQRKTNNHYVPRIFFALGWLAFLLPGVLLGIALIHAFNHNWSALLYQGAGIVILAFVIRYAVIGWQAAWQAARRTDPDLVEVALLEGANRWQLLRHVYWPQIARPVLVAWYIVFLLCLWDVESMILVVPPGGETLALRIFNLLHYGHNSQVNALCLTLLAVALVPLILERATQIVRLAWRGMRRRLTGLAQPLKNGARTRVCGAVLLACAVFVVSGCGPGSKQSAFQSTLFRNVETIGVRGVGVGQLNKPRSVAVDSKDNLFVVDMTGRVQKFSPQGAFVLSWQMPQTDRGKPKGMNHDHNGNIFVVEPHYSRVNLFSPLGKLILQWGSHGTNAGELTLPRAVAENSRGEIFVSEYQEIERVQRFSFDSQRSAPVDGSKPDLTPHWSGGFGKAGTAPGEFNRPEGLCVDVQDRLYVADSCNHRIQVFDRDGKFLRAYGKAGSGPGELSYPYDICVDKEGRQYVCEFGNSRIQVFDAHDRCLEIIGGPGVEPGRFNNPWGVALDSAGNLYVADSQNHRVQKLVRK